MPPDIRNFFGGKPASSSAEKEKEKKPPAKRGRASRRVVEDSDDDEEPQPKKTAAKQRAPSPKDEETTSADYFATKTRPKRSEPVKPKSEAPAKTKSQPQPQPQTRTRTAPTKAAPSHTEDLDEDDFPDDLDDDDDEDPPPRTRAAAKGKQTKIKEDDDFAPEEDVDMKDTPPDEDFVVPDDDEMIIEDLPAPKTTKAKPKPKAGSKRKSKDLDDDDEEEEDAPKAKKPRAPKKPKEDVQDSAAVNSVLSSIPTVRAPTPPPADGDAKSKFQWGQQHANSGPAPEAGTVEIPEGEENCLAGMTFVFTGQLRYIAREEGQSLVKRYGGKVTTAPSKNTSWVVLGSDAGPKKLEKIRDLNIKTIDEKGLFELIRKMPANGGSGKAAAKAAEAREKEEKKIREMAAEIEKEERRAGGAGGAGAGKAAASAKGNATTGPDNRLWTVKYAPTSMQQICGNKAQVDKLQAWLRNFPKNHKTGFRMAGKDGHGTYRAVMIHGPPGIGKTTAAHLVAKMEGYDIVESNASDTRSKKLVETNLKGVLSTTSLAGYFSGGGQEVNASKKKLVLIMDEVDGMSAGDRGGVGALAAVCKKTEVPMILICNDRKLPKMKPFDFVTYDLPFRRPTTDMIRARIATIAHREGLKMPPNVMSALIEGTGADIRQVINMISTAKLDQSSLNYDKGKEMSKAWEKHVILKPWDITSKILGGGMFNPQHGSTLNEKIELYFNDHEFSPLMLQENYMGTTPTLAQNEKSQKHKSLKQLELVSKAADSISDGDLVDRMIHGSQQQWSLMPAHAIFSFVRPASFVAGSMAGHGQTRFTSWLGKNSSQGKLTRMVKEVQGHMRLRTSGDRHEIRQQYLPILWQNLVNKLQIEGKDAVPEVIELMDQYFLTRDDFDAVLELGVGPMDMEKVSIPTQTKSAFTRIYNQQSHPLPFMKASTVVGAAKKGPREKPDLEEALDDSEDDIVDVKDEGEAEEAEEDMDISKDKYVAKPKKKKAAPAKSAKGKGKRTKDDDEEESEEEKPKKKAPAKAKGRAKK